MCCHGSRSLITVFLSSAKERIQVLQRSLSSRRVTLATAKSMFIGTVPVQNAPPPPPTFLELNTSKYSQQLAALSDTIARARVGLIQELVEVFDVVQVGGRPAVGGMKGAKGEWSIGGLILPVPGDVRRKRHVPSPPLGNFLCSPLSFRISRPVYKRCSDAHYPFHQPVVVLPRG